MMPFLSSAGGGSQDIVILVRLVTTGLMFIGGAEGTVETNTVTVKTCHVLYPTWRQLSST